VSALADLRVLAAAPFVAALLVLLAPARVGRAVAVVGALVVCALVWLAADGAQSIEIEWLARGVKLGLRPTPVALLGVAVTALVGLLAALEEQRRGRLAAGLALQGVIAAGLLARDVFALAGAWALAPAVAVILVAGTGSPRAWTAGRALALLLAVGAGAALLVAGGSAVALHAATGGLWSGELGELAAMRVPAGPSLALAAAATLAAIAALGLWPLHGALVEGTAEGSRGAARLLTGPLRWLGLDALIRLWGPLAPLGAAAVAPWLAGLATAGAVWAGLVARVERDAGRQAALLALVPWSLAVVGVATLAHEGFVGALILAVVGSLAPQVGTARAASGLALAVGAGLVALAGLRFADLTLGALGPWCACGAALAVLLWATVGSVEDHPGMSKEAGASGQEPADRFEQAGAPLGAVAGALLMLWIAVRPAGVIERIAAVGEGWVEAIALQRCLALHQPKLVAAGLPEERPEACESALGGLRAGIEARRAGEGGAP
jgi:NADH-quinone oxidoreductase subunit M